MFEHSVCVCVCECPFQTAGVLFFGEARCTSDLTLSSFVINIIHTHTHTHTHTKYTGTHNKDRVERGKEVSNCGEIAFVTLTYTDTHSNSHTDTHSHTHSLSLSHTHTHTHLALDVLC